MYAIFAVDFLLFNLIEELLNDLGCGFFALKFREEYHFVAQIRASYSKSKFANFFRGRLLSKLMKSGIFPKTHVKTIHKSCKIIKFQNNLKRDNAEFKAFFENYLEKNNRTVLSISTNKAKLIKFFEPLLTKFNLEKENEISIDSSLIIFSYLAPETFSLDFLQLSLGPNPDLPDISELTITPHLNLDVIDNIQNLSINPDLSDQISDLNINST